MGAELNLKFQDITFEFYSSVCAACAPSLRESSAHEHLYQTIAFQRPIHKHPTLSQKEFLVYVSASIMSYLKEENEIKFLSEIFIDLIKPDLFSEAAISSVIR